LPCATSDHHEDDICEDAADEYLEFFGEPFKFLHCLDELWKLPKFDPMQEVIEIGSDDQEDAPGALLLHWLECFPLTVNSPPKSAAKPTKGLQKVVNFCCFGGLHMPVC
jgi:hypothetical protein